MYDMAVIGGGVNGCGIARDAAGRGLSVLLVEKGDLASGTSSVSTKLIHGGLRYLENYEFGLVRESLKEREVLWGMAPHIIWPMRFVLPHHSGLRPAFIIRIGLFLYDHLGGRKRLPPCSTIDLRADPAGRPLKADFGRAFEYSDCWVEDARLVVLNAMDAAARGADVRTRTLMRSARRNGNRWDISLSDHVSGREDTVSARMLVNVAGPWVGEVLANQLGQNAKSHVRLVKGSHIVVRSMFSHDRAYIFQNADRRIVFAIPYERDFTLIGTTDFEFSGDLSDVQIEKSEIDYLCRSVSEYFVKPVTPDNVVWTYSGVRPLYDDGDSVAQKVTRDFVLELDAPRGNPPLLSVFGGKLTTYRHLAEETLQKLKPWMDGAGPAWTRGAPLPGGDFPVNGFGSLKARIAGDYPGLPQGLIDRLARAYGTRSWLVLGDAKTLADLGVRFGADLYERETAYLVRHEWAREADDILWRRSKLGLRFTPDERAALAKWLKTQPPGRAENAA